MRNRSFILLFLTIFFYLTLSAQEPVYQLRNGRMKVWESVGTNAEHAKYWNSFKNGGTGSYIGMTSQGVWRSTDIPSWMNGLDSAYSAEMRAVSVLLGIMQNGQMTTGRVNAGSMTASNGANNNYTDIANEEYNHPIQTKPDSIRFWAKFYANSATQEARINAIVHDNFNYRDPDDAYGSGSSAVPSCLPHAVGKATLNFLRTITTAPGNNGINNQGQGWQEFYIPFNYDSFQATDPKFILVTFTTNKTAGNGNAADRLFVTDVSLIYNKRLSDITVNGVTIPNFDPDIEIYNLCVEGNQLPVIGATAASPNISSMEIVQPVTTNPTATITVTHGGETKTYTINFINYTGFFESICSGEDFMGHGFNIPVQETAGEFVFTNIFPVDNECDHVAQLFLTVRQTKFFEFEDEDCHSYTWNDVTYTTPGTKIQIFEAANGCDSIVTLHLTFLDVTSDFSATAYNSYTWNNTTYSISGNYIQTFPAANGCDSIVTLHLTIYTQLMPATNEIDVAISAEVSITFSTNITANNLAGITINGTPVIASVSGNKLIISHANFLYNTIYTVFVPANTITGCTEPITWSFTSFLPLAVTRLTPNNNASKTNVATEVSVTFNKDITANDLTRITINNIPATATIQEDKLIINHAAFAFGTTYTVNVPANTISGYNQPVIWLFTTSNEPFALDFVNPLENETNVTPNQEVSVTFTLPVTPSDLSEITINNNLVYSYVSENKLIIQHAAFEYNTTYTVRVPANAITDYEEELTWSFTTLSIDNSTVPVSLLSMAPANGFINVPVANNTELSVSFNKIVTANNLTGITINGAPTTATISQSKLNINHAEFSYATVYTVYIPDNTINGYNQAITWSFTTEIQNINIETLTPAHGATNATLTNEVSITFNKNITPHNLTEIKINDTIVTATVAGRKLTIIHAAFAYSTDYTVEVPANAIEGYGQPITWSFRTRDIPVTKVSQTPEGTRVEVDAEVFVTFNTEIAANDLSRITIGNLVVTSAVIGNKLVIAHPDFAYDTSYTVTIPANSIAGYDSLIRWSFTTVAAPYTITALAPAHAASDVAIDTVVSVTFNRALTAGAIQGVTINNVTATATASGNRVTITHANFTYGKNYTVSIPANAITGYTQPIRWTFRTVNEDIAILTYLPARNEENVSCLTEVSVTFNQNISIASLMGIKINGLETNASVVGDKLLIRHPKFDFGSHYTISVPATVINGYTQPITWSFITEAKTDISVFENNEIQIYPNPSTGVVNIIVPESSKIQLIDVTGRIVQTEQVEGHSTLNFNQVSGVYFIRVESVTGTVSIHKFVINK